MHHLRDQQTQGQSIISLRIKNMQVSILLELKKDEKMFQLLKENSYWIKELNRSPTNYKRYKETMKIKYRLRATDKISDAIDNIDIISNVLNALK